MYILLIYDKITYASDDKELLQEIVMDDYFEAEYERWSNYCFPPQEFYHLCEYHTPQEWWKKFAASMGTSIYEIIDLEDYYIE